MNASLEGPRPRLAANIQSVDETLTDRSRRNEVVDISAPQRAVAESAFATPAIVKSRPQTWLAVPVGACIALAIHFFVPKREPVVPTHYYPLLLFVMLGLGLLGAGLYPFSGGLR